MNPAEELQRVLCHKLKITKDDTLAKKVSEAVTESLIDSLGLDKDEVTPDARILLELGAESIDILDIQFRLENYLESIEGTSSQKGNYSPREKWTYIPQIPVKYIDVNSPIQGTAPLNKKGVEELKDKYNGIIIGMSKENRERFESSPDGKQFYESVTVLGLALQCYESLRKNQKSK